MPIASDFEKLGVFYLGRLWDPAARRPKPDLLLYDSKDLVTHAVCVGMTGSGKTGLCLALIEEAALDGIPALVIDPKGDIANLLLTFPDLTPEDFLPWIDEDDARRKGLAPEEHARQQAERWAKGLAEWGQDGARIRRLKDAVDIAVYTPGSEAGIPISIVDSFAAPPPAIREDGELLRERVGSTATSLLGLLGVDADPVKSREHILIATILDAAWRDGRDLDLPGLVQAIQTPPVTRVGALDLETFYPGKDRFALAILVNNLLAAPGFAAWTTGDPLDVGRMLRTPEGKPRIAICSIAHLGDAERMFTVSLLLNQVLAWTRSQSGTTSLRAIVYMDEIFGFFPPVANPPSKLPLLTLLKQARAFGVGVVLATQNPVDLDYKGLANTGTWFIGRLQTERDKARVLEGLEGAAGEAGAQFDRAETERLIAGLGNRIFLMRNVHDDAPAVFETRWAMSYLRGPLTRDQIRTLMAGRARTSAGASAAETPAMPAAVTAAAAAGRPVLPPDVPQHFVPVRGAAPAGGELVYQPMLYGAADIRFADAKKGVDTTASIALMTAVTSDPVPVDWARAVEAALDPSELEAAPEADARFAELPPAAAKAKSYAAWRKELAAWLFRNRTLELHACARLRAYSAPGESEGDFRARIGHATREQRDQAVEQIRKKYAPKVAALQEKLRRAEQAVQRESEQASQQGVQAVISIGTTLIGAMLGRKAASASTLGRATTAARGAGRVLKERKDVGRAKENVEVLRQQLADLEEAFTAEAARLDAGSEAAAEPLETVAVRPARQNVAVKLLALVWVPVWQDASGHATPAWDAPTR
jgi:hypothetical protein